MEILKRQIRRAQRRLSFQRFLGLLSWCWFAALLAAAVLIGVDKFYPLGIQPWAWVAGGLGAGFLAASAWTWFTRRGDLEAAIEIDRRFGLKERVSSTYSLGPEQLDSPAGRALVDDAVKRVGRLHVAEQFRVKLSRWAWLPLAPAALAFLLAMFLNPAVGENKAGGSTQVANQRKQVRTSTKALRRKLAERKKEAEEKGLKDAEQLFKKLEQGSKRLAEAKDADRKQAMVELNDLAKDLEKRRQQLGGNQMKEQLNQLKDIRQGPGDKMADALRNGDFKQAKQELEKLREKLKQGKLDEKSKEQLTKQLDQMQQKLREMADSHQKRQDELKKQIAEKRAQGKSQEADELERQLNKLAKQSPQMKQLSKMAEKLGECAQCMKQGDQAGAQAALDSMESQLSELQEQLDEMAMLDEALDEIDAAKDAMNCKLCQGRGCKACQGGFGDGFGEGDGLGRGQGRGYRPEEKTNTNFIDSKVKQKTGKGAAVVTDFVEGPNVKGEVEQEIQTQFESARTADDDPLTGQRLPRGYREHAQKYFDSLREGE